MCIWCVMCVTTKGVSQLQCMVGVSASHYYFEAYVAHYYHVIKPLKICKRSSVIPATKTHFCLVALLDEIPEPVNWKVEANPCWWWSPSSAALSTVFLWPLTTPGLSKLPWRTPLTPRPGISRTGWLVLAPLSLSKLWGRCCFCLRCVSAVSGFHTTMPSMGQVGCSCSSHSSMHGAWYWEGRGMGGREKKVEKTNYHQLSSRSLG